MQSIQTSPLHLPSFLYGAARDVKRKARAEGTRCARQYQLQGSFPPPPRPRAVAPEEVVLTHGVVDFQEERPAWRLYLLGGVLSALGEALEGRHRPVIDAYEVFLRDTAAGALYFALSGRAPESAERTAARLGAVLRSWDSLQHGRYLHQELNRLLTLEELLTAACGWALETWCPEAAGSVRSRLEVASERMAHATREDCVEAILRGLPRILRLADAERLSHPEVVMAPASWRAHLATLDAADFERVSAACPAWVLERLYLWDRELHSPQGV